MTCSHWTRPETKQTRGNSPVSRFLLLVLLLLSTACAAPGNPKGAAEIRPEKGQVVGGQKHEDVANKPAHKTTPIPAKPRFTLLPPTFGPRAKLPAEKALNPNRLLGLLDTDVKRVLGTPDFTRLDPPAQIWQYRESACLLDIFLYQDKNRDNAYAVTHIEARGLDVNRVADKDCIFSVLKNRGPG